MKTVFITGGCGTVGTAFIRKFYDRYHFISYSRNQEKQSTLKKHYKKVALYIGAIEDKQALTEAVLNTKPDIMIHAAALKRIDIAEKDPVLAVKINILGSLNVIEAAQLSHTPITIAVSSDRATAPYQIYGCTKRLMERMFLSANSPIHRFACCRFSNVAGSDGSVIPRWLALAKNNEALTITDPNMNRFMCSTGDAADLLQKAIDLISQGDSGFTLLKKLKAVNLYDLAQCISSNIKIVGKRPGEQLNETLIEESELPLTVDEGAYVRIYTDINTKSSTRLQHILRTDQTEKMTHDEINQLITS